MATEICLQCAGRLTEQPCGTCNYRAPVLLQHPKIVDKFRVIRRLGGGAMGEVFLVESRLLPGVQSALKLIREGAKAGYLRRFHDEAHLANRVSGNYVAKLLDFDVCDGIPFARWEYVAGQTLADLLRISGRIDTVRAIRITLQVLEGLREIHRVGVHRDIKPSNIMVEHSVDGNDRVRILDFGLAKGFDSAESSDAYSFAGTLRYMAPELFGPGANQAQPSRDIYAVGVVLYEILIGDPPFMAASNEALIHAICSSEPPWIEPLAPLDVRSAELHEVVQRALTKTPEARYLTAEAFRLALAKAETAVSVEANVDATVVLDEPSKANDVVPANLGAYLENATRDLREAQLRFARSAHQRAFVRNQAIVMAQLLQIAADRLRGGELITNYHDCSLLTESLARLGQGDELVGLTAWKVDSGWWKTGDAQRYREANAQAIAQGATVRRIFVFDEDDSSGPSLHELADEMERHAKLGVAVKKIERRSLPLNMPELRSQCVVSSPSQHGRREGWLTYKVEFDAAGMPWHNIFSVRPDAIQRSAQQLEALWREAEEYVPLRRSPTRRLRRDAGGECGEIMFGECDPPVDEVSDSQLVRPGQNDGRRLYIHETSFEELARQGSKAAAMTYDALLGVPVLRLLPHDIEQEAVGTHGFRKEAAAEVCSVVSTRWSARLTAFLRNAAVVNSSNNIQALLATEESVVATCFDANYFTFATTPQAATRMYQDVLKISLVRRAVSAKGDAYRDLTLIKGPKLSLRESGNWIVRPAEGAASRRRIGMDDTELEAIKLRVLSEFEIELRETIEAAWSQPTMNEVLILTKFRAKVAAAVRESVLHLRVQNRRRAKDASTVRMGGAS